LLFPFGSCDCALTAADGLPPTHHRKPCSRPACLNDGEPHKVCMVCFLADRRHRERDQVHSLQVPHLQAADGEAATEAAAKGDEGRSARQGHVSLPVLLHHPNPLRKCVCCVSCVRFRKGSSSCSCSCATIFASANCSAQCFAAVLLNACL